MDRMDSSSSISPSNNKMKNDVFSSSAFLVTKHSWKGKYKRILSVGSSGAGIATLNPATMEATNNWAYTDIVTIAPIAGNNASSNIQEFQLVFKKKGNNNNKKPDTMKFSSDYRRYLLTDVLKHHEKFLVQTQQTNKTYLQVSLISSDVYPPFVM